MTLRMRPGMAGIAAGMMVLIISAVTLAAPLAGFVEYVNDGDTFIIQGQSIRLKGVDAPELAQKCKDKTGRNYLCGEQATKVLKALVKNQEVTCAGSEKDKYDRLIAHCYAGNLNLNATLVEMGWAVAFIAYDDVYAPLEIRAKKEKKGIWQGEFMRPVAFRSASWDRASRLAKQQGEDCLIKGNINSKGVRIYHTPWGSRHYNRTRISVGKGERWFCTEAEALMAGWRAPYR